MRQILTPFAPVPAVSMSIFISAFAARDVSEITAGVAAVDDLRSLASMVSVVENMDADAVAPSASGSSFKSNAGLPELDTVLIEAVTLVSVNA